MKRITALFLACLLILSFPLCSHAEYRPLTGEYRITQALQQGDELDVLIKLTSTDGVGGGLFTLVYERANQDYIEFIDFVEYYGKDEYVIVANDNHDDQVTVNVVSKNNDNTNTEAYFVAKFKCVNEAAKNKLAIKVNCEEVIDSAGTILTHPNAHCRVAAAAVNGEYDTDVPPKDPDSDTETDTSTTEDTSTGTDTSSAEDTSTGTDTSSVEDTNTETDTSTWEDTSSDTDTAVGSYKITLIGNNCTLIDSEGNSNPTQIISEPFGGISLFDLFGLGQTASFKAVPDEGYILTGDDNIAVEGDYSTVYALISDIQTYTFEYTINGIKSDLTVTVTAVPINDTETDTDTNTNTDTDTNTATDADTEDDTDKDTDESDGAFTITLIGNNCTFIDSDGEPCPSQVKSEKLFNTGTDFFGFLNLGESATLRIAANEGCSMVGQDEITVEGDYLQAFVTGYDYENKITEYYIFGITSDLTVTATAALPQTDTDTDTNTNTETDVNTDTDTDTQEGSYTITLIGINCTFVDSDGNPCPSQIKSTPLGSFGFFDFLDLGESALIKAVPNEGYNLNGKDSIVIEGDYSNVIPLLADIQTKAYEYSINGIKSDLTVTVTAVAEVVTDTDTPEPDTDTNTDTETPKDTPEPGTDTNTDTEKPKDTPEPGTDTNTDTETPKDTSDPGSEKPKDPNDTDTDKPKKDYIYGDVNIDSKITAKDSLLVLRYTIMLAKFDDEIQLTLADVSGDGKITAADSMAILRYSISMHTSSRTGEVLSVLDD